MYGINNEDKIFENEINDLNDIEIKNQKIKNNKYNEDQIIMDDNMNVNINMEEQDNINIENNDNYDNNINDQFQGDDEYYNNNENNFNYDINEINNEEFNNSNNLEENNINNNDIYEDQDENLLYENNEQIDLIDQAEDEQIDNEINQFNNNTNQNINIEPNNDIESLKMYISNLENKCYALEKENKLMKLNKQNSDYIDRNDPNYKIIENSVKQGTILLDDVKRKNFNLSQRIKILEKENQKLNYKLIEVNQKLKRFQSNKNNINNNKDINSIIAKLNSRIDESDIIISKLKFDKCVLETKLSEEKKYHENELNLMLNYKNSELSVYQKAIDNFKAKKNNNNILNTDKNNQIFQYSDYESKINSLTNKLNIISSEKKSLKEKINLLSRNISEKDNTINILNKKLIELEGNFNLKLVEMQQIDKENETKINQLINEKNELLKSNEKLSKGLLQFDNKVKEANLIFINKTEFYDKTMSIYKNKIKEYKNKIIILKNKINELNMSLEKNKIINYAQRNNNNDNNIFKLKSTDIYPKNILSTPGSFLIPKRKTTPHATKFFDEQNEYINNKSMNMNKTSIDIYENEINMNNNTNYLNKSQISQNNENYANQYGLEEEKIEDNNQKLYLEKYKYYISNLNTQL